MVAYPDRGKGNDPEPFFFFFRGVGSLSQPRLNIFTVGNMRVMICLGQGGLRSLSASSFHIMLATSGNKLNRHFSYQRIIIYFVFLFFLIFYYFLFVTIYSEPAGRSSIGYTRDFCFYYGPDIIHHIPIQNQWRRPQNYPECQPSGAAILNARNQY